MDVEADAKYRKVIERVAHNIKRIRLARKLTQEDMADFGFSYRWYQKVESGKYSPNLYSLHRIAYAFKVDIKRFFE